jgi:hypothetical protein
MLAITFIAGGIESVTTHYSVQGTNMFCSLILVFVHSCTVLMQRLTAGGTAVLPAVLQKILGKLSEIMKFVSVS